MSHKPWPVLEEHLGEASQHVAIGTGTPRVSGLSLGRRLFARPAVKMVQLFSRAITRRQTQYNHSLLEAVRELGNALTKAEARIDQLEARCRELEATAEPLHTRPNTLDWAIWNEVRNVNEYRLPDRFEADDVIIDIGAHIGSFSYVCLQRGAGKAYCFEPEPNNFSVLSTNLARFGERIVTSSEAVFRNDHFDGKLFWSASKDQTNTGGGDLLDASGLEVNWTRFDDVVDRALQGRAKRIRLLKLDCEAAEYPILFTSERLDLIDEIRGEYHEVEPEKTPKHWRLDGVERLDRWTLKRFLESKGFRVELEGNDTAAGLFFATRRGC